MNKSYVISLTGMFLTIFFVRKLDDSQPDNIYNYIGIAFGLLLIAYAWYDKFRNKSS